MAVLDREGLLKQIERRLGQEYTEAEILAESALLKRLRLIPQQLDYKAAILKLMKEQVAGFYDPDARKLYLADWIPLKLQEPALVHEICHALQDQHFKLKRLVKPLKENSDRQLAYAALVEGDCTGAMMEYALAPRGLDLSALPDDIEELAKGLVPGDQTIGAKDTPPFLRETLAFPYLRGLALIKTVRAKYSWATVNRMFKRPPETTEQILHRMKYWRRERAVRIKPRTLPALASYTRVKQDVLGEFQLSLLLAQAVSKEIAARSAAGWGGDLIQIYGHGTSAPPPAPSPAPSPAPPLLLMHLTTWDSDADAKEFANAMRYVMADRRLAPLPGGVAGIWLFKESKELRWLLQIHQQHVLILGGVPATMLADLHKELWGRWRIGGRKVTAPLWQDTPPPPGSPPADAPPDLE